MAVLQMQKVGICALKRDRKAILEKIQSLGVLEISQMPEGEEGFEKMNTQGARNMFEKNVLLADAALETLQEYAPEKKSILSSLEGKKLVEKDKFQDAANRVDEIMTVASGIMNNQKKIAEYRANIQKLENQIETLAPWMSLDIPMAFRGTKSSEMLLGSMPAGLALEDIYALVLERAPEAAGVDISVLSTERDAIYLAVLCLKRDAAKVEDALRQGGFVRPSQFVAQIPANEKENLEKQIRKYQEEIGVCQEEISKCESERMNLRLAADYYQARSEKYEVLGQLLQSKRTFTVQGYVPKKAAPALEKALNENFVLSLEIEDIPEDEEAPVLLSNNGFSESVEGVLSSYGLPHKGEVDPTFVMSIFYVFLFGLMLSDAAYGFIMFLACFLVLKKFPRMESGMRKNVKMFMYCGVSTLVWGVLFGGYFGDAIDVIARTFFHVEIPETGLIPAVWFVPLKDPMRMLIYSMGFGLIHLFTGLGMKGYMLLKEKKIVDFLCDVVLWYVFLAGLILLLIPSDIFASIAQLEPGSVPAFVGQTGKILAIVGVVGLILMSGRSSKNIGLRLALGLYDVYNVTGWLSDVLSYSRLLALGLATGVIASVINQMGSMVGDGIFGAVVFILVFIVGHSLNMAINLLGAYVHTNRLQFVEFFGKFYEGGGQTFTPFRANTKYVEIKEES